MPISDKDLKKLWGLAAGKCSKPGCGEDLIPKLELSKDTILGEMAHIIPDSPSGPRGDGKKEGSDTYENLILLCPTHHRLIDKAEVDFPRELLFEWKQYHESSVKARLSSKVFIGTTDLAQYIHKLLSENYSIWSQFGPESKVAKSNPFSSAADLWELRKLATIIPNNEEISNLLRAHRSLFTDDDYSICAEFIEHAIAFEANSYRRMDSDAVPRFPTEFQNLIERIT